MEWPALGRPPRAGVCRVARSSSGDRTPTRWFALAALPGSLPTAGSLPGTSFRKSFRPTACRTRETKSKSSKGNQTQIPCASGTPLEKTMEADISILRKNRTFLLCVDTRLDSRRDRSTQGSAPRDTVQSPDLPIAKNDSKVLCSLDDRTSCAEKFRPDR